MARLRVRFRFNPGRVGSPMDKLGEFASQTEKFLRSMAFDLGVKAKKGEWLAQNFTNESVAFDAEFADEVVDTVQSRALSVFETITGKEPLEASNRGLVSLDTMAEFSRIGRIMDPDEKFLIGLYRTQLDEPSDWREVTFRQIAEIRLLLDAPIPAYGSVQGIVYSWHSGAMPPFFQLRELAAGGLVRCVYNAELHASIHLATRAPNTVVHVYGDMRWDRVSNSIIDVAVNDLEVAEPLTETEFDQIFGSIPEFTGDESTADYVETMRGNG